MIGIYLRVSSGSQDTASQELELRQWASTRQDVQWFSDKFTGKSMDRPGMNKLLAAIRQGKVTTVVVWRLDRLGRTASGLVALIEELTSRRVNLISLKDGVDLSTAAGRLLAHVLASVASYETEIRGERVKAGLEVKKARVAAGLEPWSSKPQQPRQPRKATPAVVEAVKEQKARNVPVVEIARTLHLSRQTVYTILEG